MCLLCWFFSLVGCGLVVGVGLVWEGSLGFVGLGIY